MTVSALGVVFGDIGTSPLYSLQTVFSAEHNAVAPNREDVFGVISMVFWTITLIVTVKYVWFVMRAHNEGEGGILALVALLRESIDSASRMGKWVLMGGIIGAGLFYGDSLITPAISVMSAFEGLTVVNKEFETWVLPLSIVILSVLFIFQRFGTEKVGKAFGPVMVLWFSVLAVLGIPHILHTPEILGAISPHHSFQFALEHPHIWFIALGAAVLTITGAEALYADMGHFGPLPIRVAWFVFVFPALTLNYLGQGALILNDPKAVDNPFFRMAPSWATIPLVLLATAATVIASQSVISGAFSVSRQAIRLGLLPHLTVRHTSKVEGGQIYVPAINWILFGGVLILIGIFQSSFRLATAYGLAVTGTLLFTTALFGFLAHFVWKWHPIATALFVTVLGGLELMILAANFTKIISGGWIPLVIAAMVMVIMTTWHRGSTLITERRHKLEGSLQEFVDAGNEKNIPRIKGLSVFPHSYTATVPLALRKNVDFNRVMHEKVVIINILYENVPHIRHVERVTVNDLGHPEEGIFYVDCRVGFNDSNDVPKALALALSEYPELRGLTEADALYFLSSGEVKLANNRQMARWRKLVFRALSRNQADRNAEYKTPTERSITMGVEVYL